jgi:hypothetical protein
VDCTRFPSLAMCGWAVLPACMFASAVVEPRHAQHMGLLLFLPAALIHMQMRPERRSFPRGTYRLLSCVRFPSITSKLRPSAPTPHTTLLQFMVPALEVSPTLEVGNPFSQSKP